MDNLTGILEHKGRRVYSCGPDAIVLDLAREMGRLHIGALLVVQDGRPVGIISERDILNKVVVEHRDPAATRARDIMTRDVVAVGLDCSPEQAMAIMTERRIRHLPVVLDTRVIGMISIGDLVRWVSRTQEYEIRLLKDYVMGKYPG